MTKEIRVEVEALHIQRGTAESLMNCPIGRALEAATGAPAYVTKDGVMAFNGEGYSIYTAVGLKTFVSKFDARKPVKPRTFIFRGVS